MISINDIIGISKIQIDLNVKCKSDEELKSLQLDKKYLDYIKNSKSGYIKIKKISKNSGYLSFNEIEEGWTGCFGENISCYIYLGPRWFRTSLIKHIDWENNTFETQNSIYSFEFTEYSPSKLLNILENAKVTSNNNK